MHRSGAAFLLLHSPLVDDTPVRFMSLLSKGHSGILFPVACWAWDMLRNPKRQGPVSLSFGRTRSPSRSQRIQVAPPCVNPLVYPLMEPDRGMNVSASPNMARVVKERTGNPPRDPVCVFCPCCIRKTPRRLGTDVREFGPGEPWGSIMELDKATEACLSMLASTAWTSERGRLPEAFSAGAWLLASPVDEKRLQLQLHKLDGLAGRAGRGHKT